MVLFTAMIMQFTFVTFECGRLRVKSIFLSHGQEILDPERLISVRPIELVHVHDHLNGLTHPSNSNTIRFIGSQTQAGAFFFLLLSKPHVPALPCDEPAKRKLKKRFIY